MFILVWTIQTPVPEELDALWFIHFMTVVYSLVDGVAYPKFVLLANFLPRIVAKIF